MSEPESTGMFRYGGSDVGRAAAPEGRAPRLEDARLFQRMSAARVLCRQTGNLEERWVFFAMAVWGSDWREAAEQAALRARRRRAERERLDEAERLEDARVEQMRTLIAQRMDAWRMAVASATAA